jgi:glycosyltransferase involved in cell wall biosynthesis
MRILLLYWGRRGGGAEYTYELSKALKSDTDIELFLSLSKQVENYQKFSFIGRKNRCDVDTFNNAIEFIVKSIFIKEKSKFLIDFIKTNNVDLVICSMTHMWMPFIAKSVQELGVSYVPIIHDANPHPGEGTMANRWLSKESLKHSNGYIVLSSAVEGQLKERIDSAVFPIWKMPHGPLSIGSLGQVRTLDKSKKNKIIFLGRIHKYKGLDIFIDAMRLLYDKGFNFSAEIMGEGDMNPFKNNLKGLGFIKVENRWISQEEFSSALLSADLLVLPYREASQSGVVAAAMSSGLPIIVTPVGGLSEQIKHRVNGIISTDVTVESIVESIECILNDKSLYHSISIGAFDSTNNTHSWNESVNTIKQIWHYFN